MSFSSRSEEREMQILRLRLARCAPDFAQDEAKPSRAGGLCHLGCGVKTSRRLGSGFGFGFGAFLVSFLPLSLFPMADSVTQKAGNREQATGSSKQRKPTTDNYATTSFLLSRAPSPDDRD
jgi:hypothetical protein